MTFEELVKALEKLGAKDLGSKIAAKAAPHLEEALKANLSAGVSPEGQAWAPRKENGGRAYAKAASKLDVKALGDLVKVTVTGPEVYGHFGAGGMPVRKMIPDGGDGVPKVVAEALQKGAEEALEEVTNG